MHGSGSLCINNSVLANLILYAKIRSAQTFGRCVAVSLCGNKRGSIASADDGHVIAHTHTHTPNS